MAFLQRERNLHGCDKRALKTSPSSFEPERGEKRVQRALRTHQGLLNVTVSLMELWPLVFLAAKPNAVRVCVTFASTLTGLEQPDFWLCHKTLGFKQEFVVHKDSVEERWKKWELQRNVLDFGKEMNWSEHDSSEWKENKGRRNENCCRGKDELRVQKVSPA